MSKLNEKKLMNNPSKSQYLFKFYVFNKTPCICHNQGRITSGRDFDLEEGVAISFEKCIFVLFFLYNCTAEFQNELVFAPGKTLTSRGSTAGEFSDFCLGCKPVGI